MKESHSVQISRKNGVIVEEYKGGKNGAENSYCNTQGASFILI